MPNDSLWTEGALESLRREFGDVYAGVGVTVNAAIGEGDTAAVRITLRARALGAGTKGGVEAGGAFVAGPRFGAGPPIITLSPARIP